MEAKKPSAMKSSTKLFLLCLAVVIFYHISHSILKYFGITYRTWVQIIGGIFTAILLPLSLLCIPFFACYRKNKEKKTNTVLSVFGMLGIICIFPIYLLIITLITVKFGIIYEKEIYFADGIIENGQYSGEESRLNYKYYEPVTIFCKRKYEPYSDIMCLKLEKEYGEAFAVAFKNKDSVYKMYPVNNPNITFHMMDGPEYYSYNDYMQERANDRIIQYIENKNLSLQHKKKMESGILEKFTEGMSFVISSREEAESISEKTAQIIAYVLEDEFFKTEGHASKIFFILQDAIDMTGENIILDIPFGNGYEGTVYDEYSTSVPSDYYTNADNIYAKLQEAYRRGTVAKAEVLEDEQALLDEQDAVEAMDPDVITPSTVEGAYKVLFDEVFAKNGDSYDCRYNAKGNFYGLLYEGKGKLNAETEEMDIDRTVVYDRVSKNGAYHIFVNYENYYDESGNNYTTKIVDFYAVNMQTGEVIRADKQAWEDVGTKEYREKTGE